MRRSVAELSADIDRAQAASQSGIIELLASHEAKMIDRMVGLHRGGKLTPEQAVVALAVVSEFRLLAEQVRRAVLRGTDAAADLIRG